MSHEKCSAVLDAFAMKVKEREDIAQHYALEYTKTDNLEAKVACIAAMREARIWRDASEWFSKVMIG